MQFVNFLIKPASSLCNMRCRYCFYEDEAANRTQASMGIMTRETADLLIGEALDAVDFNGRLSFAFQGGEPTVAGLDFFRHFVEEVTRRNTRHIPVNYSIQTNGLAHSVCGSGKACFYCNARPGGPRPAEGPPAGKPH